MRKLFKVSGLLPLAFLLTSAYAFSQLEVSIRVDTGIVSTTCTDLIGPPDPLWGVSVAGGEYVYYPAEGPCFNDFPNTQYTASFNCVGDLPATVEVCFRGLENDPIVGPPVDCSVVPGCVETVCRNIVLPAPGTSRPDTIMLAPGGNMEGTLWLTVSVSNALADNDLPCGAVDLGVLTYGGRLGDTLTSVYQNLCAGNTSEPNPFDDNSFINDAGVWFRFTTGPNPSSLIFLDLVSDPLAGGDEINTEVAVYTSSNNACDGNLSLLVSASDEGTLDSRLQLRCLAPNTTYFLLVDGGNTAPGWARGFFGLQLWDIGVVEGGDLRCDFEDLGVVPTGGSVTTDSLRSNFCATDVQDPFVAAFVSQKSVWFSFIAPPSGHVLIEGISDTAIYPLDVQLALYRSFNDQCNGGFGHIRSQYTDDAFDEVMEATCLFAGRRYFVLVDGSGTRSVGLFSLTVRDAGDITPVTVIDTVLCAGESLRVGSKVYTASGSYADTLPVFAGCDSIVLSNITVLPPLELTVTQTQPALGVGNANGRATAVSSGGAGGYAYLWCNGESAAMATALAGGESCCVTVTDANGCQTVECFEVEYITDIIPSFENDTLRCHGDSDGIIRFSALNGLPPYQYTWRNSANTLNGSGTITTPGAPVDIPDLPAGDYTFTLTDPFHDTTFVARVIEPAELIVDLVGVADATCFGSCDGSIEVSISGGTGAYDIRWSTGAAGNTLLSGLCASGQSGYSITVSDANGCQAILMANVDEPLPFEAEGVVLQPVSCFQGADGRATVSTRNGSPVRYRWSTGATTAEVSGLPAGFYEVTVTNERGCEALASLQVTQPSAPLAVEIRLTQGIRCADSADGILLAVPSGPAGGLQFTWNNGSDRAEAGGLSSGTYSVEVVNDKGCTASDSYQLEAPPPIDALVTARDITCLDPPDGGAVFIDEVTGGQGGFQYALSGRPFQSVPAFNNLPAGSYEVTVRDQTACQVTYPVSVMGPPELTVTLGTDQTIRLGDTIRLHADANSLDLRYSWTPMVSGAGARVAVSPLISTVYAVEVYDTLTFCTARASVWVNVRKDRRIYVPNAFSPNLDGNNDYFFIFGGNDVNIIESFRVFSRNGALVYEVRDILPNDVVNGWDGKLNGRPLNAGIYVYVAEINFKDGQTEIFKGDVLLVR